jgi:hypothetical protein
MTPIDTVRLKTGDKSTLKRQRGMMGNGSAVLFSLDQQNILSSPSPRIYVDNVLYTDVVQYTIDLVNGTLIFTVAPLLGSDITAEYYWSVYTDEEIQQFLTEAGNNTDYAAAKNLMAWAASKSKVAMIEILNGGADMGMTRRDTSVVAQELRATASAMIEIYKENRSGDLYQDEGLTEVAWTEQMNDRAIEQQIIRNWP